MNRTLRLLARLSASLLVFAVICVNASIFFKVSGNASPLSSVPAEKRLDILTDEVLSRMTVREKIGQLVMVNYYGDDLTRVSELIRKYSLSGIMLKAENIRNRTFEQIKSANRELSAAAGRFPLLISVDQEGGAVSRLNGVLKSYPFPSEIYLSRGKNGIAELADYTSSRLKDLMINVNFSPVVDLAVKSDSIVYKRSFSADPSVNTELGRLYVEHSRKNGVIAVPKHYPGYGNVGKDPHTDICVDSTRSLDDLSAPFFNLTDSKMIMSSHVIFSNYDDRPATLSRKILMKLRNCYSNVIITDDIQMKAITRIMDYKKAAVESIRAGCDIVLSVTLDEEKWYRNAAELCDYIIEKYQDGELPQSAIDEPARRVIRMKLSSFRPENWGIIREMQKVAWLDPSMRD